LKKFFQDVAKHKHGAICKENRGRHDLEKIIENLIKRGHFVGTKLFIFSKTIPKTYAIKIATA
jgi:hypothetical protein